MSLCSVQPNIRAVEISFVVEWSVLILLVKILQKSIFSNQVGWVEKVSRPGAFYQGTALENAEKLIFVVSPSVAGAKAHHFFIYGTTKVVP